MAKPSDFQIANQSHTAFRSDLNEVLEYISRNNSDATEPNATYPGQFWHDTTTGILKQRNAADSAWVEIYNYALNTKLNRRFIVVQVVENTTDVATGDQGVNVPIPFAGTLVSVHAEVKTAGSSGSATTVDINKNGSSILSTKLTIDNTETGSDTAATAAVISDSTVSQYDVFTFDLDAVSTTPAQGLTITLGIDT